MSIFERSQSYRPFKYPFAVEAAKKHTIDMHWAEHQVELQDDLIQYNSQNGLKTDNVTLLGAAPSLVSSSLPNMMSILSCIST